MLPCMMGGSIQVGFCTRQGINLPRSRRHSYVRSGSAFSSCTRAIRIPLIIISLFFFPLGGSKNLSRHVPPPTENHCYENTILQLPPKTESILILGLDCGPMMIIGTAELIHAYAHLRLVVRDLEYTSENSLSIDHARSAWNILCGCE